MSKKKSKEKAETGIQQAAAPITQAGQQVYEVGKGTPQEMAQYAGSFDIGKAIEAILRYQQGLGQAPTGYLAPEEQFQKTGGALGRGLYEEARGGLGVSPEEAYFRETGAPGRTLYGQIMPELQDPYAYYESTLQPQLNLAEDYINRRAQQRGLLRSGLPIEQMGRAGVELAIQEANNRLAYRQQALSRGAGLAGDISSARGTALGRAGGMYDVIQGQAAQNLANLSGLYGQQQQYGQAAMGRQLQAAGGRLGAAEAAAPYNAYGSQAKLGSLYGRESALTALPGQLLGAGATIGSAFIPRTINYQYPQRQTGGYPYGSQPLAYAGSLY